MAGSTPCCRGRFSEGLTIERRPAGSPAGRLVANLKGLQVSPRGLPTDLNLCHTGSRWPVLAPVYQVLHAGLLAFGQNLHGTIGAVAYPALQPQVAGLALRL